jgi:hypothetical protein
MSETEERVKTLAKDLGDSLIGRLKKYLKDETDTDFLKEMATELAQLQVKAMTATTKAERELAKEDMGFVHGRIDTFIARHALKIKNEFKAIFEEVIKTATEVVVIIAKTALNTVLPGAGDIL